MISKTAAGQQIVSSGDHSMPRALRSILVMVDGKRSRADLQQFATAARAPEDWLVQLIAAGYVVDSGGGVGMPTPASAAAPTAPAPGAADSSSDSAEPRADAFERFRAASGMVREMVKDSFGMKAFLFTLRVEKCSTAADLRALLPEIAGPLAKAKGPILAASMIKAAEELLAD